MPGPSKIIAAGTCPCLGVSSRPPGRTIVYGMPERCSASSPRFFQNRTCSKVTALYCLLKECQHAISLGKQAKGRPSVDPSMRINSCRQVTNMRSKLNHVLQQHSHTSVECTPCYAPGSHKGLWRTPQSRFRGKKGSSAPMLLTRTICFSLALRPTSTRFATPCKHLEQFHAAAEQNCDRLAQATSVPGLATNLGVLFEAVGVATGAQSLLTLVWYYRHCTCIAWEVVVKEAFCMSGALLAW